MKALLLTLLYSAALLLSANAYSGDDIVLTVSGKGCCNNKGKIEFTRQQLLALPQTDVTTTTPWTQGSHVYRGVLLKTLLNSLDIHSVNIKAIAQNDYWAVIPAADIAKYPVLLAIAEDGKPLTLRNKGPVWIIYPLTDHPELDKEQYHSLMVWQVVGLAGL